METRNERRKRQAELARYWYGLAVACILGTLAIRTNDVGGAILAALPAFAFTVVGVSIQFSEDQIHRKWVFWMGCAATLAFLSFIVFAMHPGPQFEPILQEYVAGAIDGQPNRPVLFLIVQITNEGIPSAIKHYDISIKVDGKSYSTDSQTIGPLPLKFQLADGNVQEYFEKDQLYNKDSEPIPQGGYIEGSIKCTANIDYETLAQADIDGKLEIYITITDGLDHIRTYELRGPHVHPPVSRQPMYHPGVYSEIVSPSGKAIE